MTVRHRGSIVEKHFAPAPYAMLAGGLLAGADFPLRLFAVYGNKTPRPLQTGASLSEECIALTEPGIIDSLIGDGVSRKT